MKRYTEQQIKEVQARVDSTKAYNRIWNRSRQKLRSGVIDLDTYDDIQRRIYRRKLIVLQPTNFNLHLMALQEYEECI